MGTNVKDIETPGKIFGAVDSLILNDDNTITGDFQIFDNATSLKNMIAGDLSISYGICTKSTLGKARTVENIADIIAIQAFSTATLNGD